MLGKTRSVFPAALAALLLFVSPAAALAKSASADGMTVEADLEGGRFVMEVNGIQHPEQDQLLAFTLTQEAPGGEVQLLYADAKYVNGREDISLSFPLSVSSLEDCVLTVQNEAGAQKVVLDFSPEETEPGGEETQPGGGETEPSGEETQPGGEETQPSGGETKPGGEETQPGGGETEPSGEETQPSGTETQPGGGETKPSGTETKPGGGETPPKTGDSSRLLLYGAVCLAAAAGAAVAVYRKKAAGRGEDSKHE